MNFDLKDKTALVTGGSRGIGLAVAKAMLEEGARVVVCGRKKEGLNRAAEDLGHPENLTMVQAHIGNRAEALATLKQIEAAFAKGEVDGRDVAIVYAALGENDKAFEWLEKDFQNHNVQLIELRMEIPFISLRSDARFKDLLTRMNMPDWNL